MDQQQLALIGLKISRLKLSRTKTFFMYLMLHIDNITADSTDLHYLRR